MLFITFFFSGVEFSRMKDRWLILDCWRTADDVTIQAHSIFTVLLYSMRLTVVVPLGTSIMNLIEANEDKNDKFRHFQCPLFPISGQSLAYAVATTLRILQSGWSLFTNECTQGSELMPLLVYKERNPKLRTPHFVDDWSISNITMSRLNKISFTQWTCQCHSCCKKYWLSGRHYGIHFMAECNYWLCKLKIKHNSLWNDTTKEDKLMTQHSMWHRCWPTSVVSIDCRGVANKSYVSTIHGAFASCKWSISPQAAFKWGSIIRGGWRNGTSWRVDIRNIAKD